MKRVLAVAVLGLMLSACALPMEEYADRSYPGQRQRTNGDIIVDVPEGRGREGRRAERQAAAEECLKYGRTYRRRSNGEYSCVEHGREVARGDAVRREWERPPGI